MTVPMNYKPPLELSSNSLSDKDKINASVIWLHGLGADGYDFEPVAQRLLQQLNLPNLRFILPHAPDRAVTRNNGYVMPAWYDIYGLTPITKEDESGINCSQTYVNALIQREIDRGVPTQRIVIAGFSQGGAIALHTALRYPKRLAGILALSTYLPLQAKLASEANPANAGIPIFMAHGTFDDIITLETCKASLNILQSNQTLATPSITLHEYNMAHSVCAAEIADIQDFLQQVLQQDLVE